MNPQKHLAIPPLGYSKKLNLITKTTRLKNILQGNIAYPFAMNSLRFELNTKCERTKYGEFVCGVDTVNVRPRIRFCIALCLSQAKRIIK